MKQLENIEKEINSIVNKKISKPEKSITKELTNTVDKITILKRDLTESDEIKYADYLIEKCKMFNTTVEVKQIKF